MPGRNRTDWSGSPPGMVGRERSEARPLGSASRRTVNGVNREQAEGGSDERGEP
ncbi:hypothetical protein [Natrialba hulunbeirensis]|uniref:hypothetical protein n=1 Tax=Natrialba hulunbeirensis TaxID=123783 RepID=UPI00135F1930|nr:hypothetical protein [Natrialba hulunbeirensis]